MVKSDSKKEFSVLVLCGGAPRHLYVANTLAEATNVVGIVLEVGSRSPGLQKILKTIFRPHILYRKVRRLLLDRYLASGSDEERFFFAKGKAKLTQESLATRVGNINDKEVMDLVKKHQPDVIAVFGTSLIKEPLLSSAKQSMINLHGGLSPHYRGADCTFWALYNQEPDQVGCTLHYIDPGIDTGMLIAHISPEVTPDDSENSLFWKGVKESAKIYCELMDKLKTGRYPGKKQMERGCLYQVKKRTMSHQKKLESSLENGLLEKVNLPTRIVWFK
ncbi:MAG: formyl transferase [Magnetococcales bacterium]|nr:formyl transferase [Magnetococcales bacterium]